MVWRIWKDEDGSALLEGAIVVPVAFFAHFGTLELSFYFFQQHLVATGVRDAARYLARTDPANGAVRTIAQNLAATGSPSGGSMRRVQGFNPADVAISFTDNANVVGVSGVRPYREAADVCGGPDFVRTINCDWQLRLYSLCHDTWDYFLSGLGNPSRTVYRTWMMPSESNNFGADETGGVLVEATVMLVILFVFALGSVDFLMAMTSGMRRPKPSQQGARISRGVFPGFERFLDPDGLSGGVNPRRADARFLAGCASGSCSGGTFNSSSLNTIVYGRGNSACETQRRSIPPACVTFSPAFFRQMW